MRAALFALSALTLANVISYFADLSLAADQIRYKREQTMTRIINY